MLLSRVTTPAGGLNRSLIVPIYTEEGIVRLEPGETKNGKGGTLFLEPELVDLFKAILQNRRLDCQLVFHRDRKKIGDFRKSWRSACQQAKIPRMLFHDLRRSGVRNMVRAGIPETVAMAISGHKTRAVFDRYNITSDDDLKEAAKKRQAFIEGQSQRLRFSYVCRFRRSGLMRLFAKLLIFGAWDRNRTGTATRTEGFLVPRSNLF
jgi:hypothetical protein